LGIPREGQKILSLRGRGKNIVSAPIYRPLFFLSLYFGALTASFKRCSLFSAFSIPTKWYCPAKTDSGRKWCHSKDVPFALNRFYFIFTLKGKLLFNVQKNGFSGLNQNMWLIHFNGVAAAHN
jgi:hypothetical protein